MQSSLGSALLPEELARICDGLKSNGTVCQGFTIDSKTKRAVFKGQPSNLPFDMANNACNEPGLSFWALNSGETFRLIMHALNPALCDSIIAATMLTIIISIILIIIIIIIVITSRVVHANSLL